MPFNGSGTFSIINTFVPNTTILSAAVNQNFSDIATGLSDCLTRDGQAGMSAVFKAIAGSIGAPGISFTSDPTAGIYLPATGEVGLVAKSLGLIVNSAIFQASTATVQAGGSGYAVGDTIVLSGGVALSLAVLQVATLSGSAVATATVVYGGNYTTKPSDPVAQGSTSGSGTGATFNVTWAAQFASSVVTNEGGALPWQRLGAASFAAGLMVKATAYDYLRALATFSSGFSIDKTTSPPTITTTINPTLLVGWIAGLTMSTAGSSTTMTVSSGIANDSASASTLMRLVSPTGKTTASWAVGTGNGGLDTGSIAANTWYHFYIIERTDTGVVDVIFSLSASSPTLPTSYTLYRRVGAGRTNGSSQWTKFTQTLNEFIWDAATTDSGTAGTSRSNLTLTVPTGIVVKALGRASFAAGGTSSVIFTSLQESDQSPGGAAPNADLTQTAAGVASLMNIERWTNTSAQIGMRSTNAGTAVTVFTYGWVDPRGVT